MKIRLLAIIAAAAFIFSACSDSSTNPPASTKNYFPTTVGSSWQYEYSEIDSAGKDIGTPHQYTTSATRTVDTLGKTKAVIMTISPNGYSYPTVVEGSSLWMFEKSFDFAMGGVSAAPQWNKYADFTSQAQWNIYDTTITGAKDTLDINGTSVPVTIDGTLTIVGKNNGTETVTVKGKTYTDCARITQTFNTTIKVKGSILGLPLEIPITSTTTSTHWFADGVGMVKSISTALIPKADLSNIPLPLQSTVADAVKGMSSPGNRTDLISSTIVK